MFSLTVVTEGNLPDRSPPVATHVVPPPLCRTWSSGRCQTEAHQRKTGDGDGDGVRGDGGQRRQLPHRTGLPGPRGGLSVRPGLQRHRAGGNGSGRGMAGRCPAVRLRRPLLARGVVGRAGRLPSGAERCGTPTGATGSTTSPSAKNGGPARPCPRPRWCAGNWPGRRRSRWFGVSKEEVEEIFWDAVTQARAELAGVPRK